MSSLPNHKTIKNSNNKNEALLLSNELVAIADRLKQGLSLHQAGKIAQAIEHYEAILNISLEHIDTLHLLGTALIQSKEFNRAIELLEKVLKLDPDHISAYMHLGIALKNAKRFDDALNIFNRAIELDPNNPLVLYNKANLLMLQGHHKDCVSLYEKCIEIKPDYVDAYINLGVAHRSQNRISESVEVLKTGLSIDPRNTKILVNLGNALLANSEFDQAIKFYNLSISMDKTFYKAFEGRAQALIKLRKLDCALADLKQLRRLIQNEIYLDGLILHLQLKICDWSNLNEGIINLVWSIKYEKKIIDPFSLLSVIDDPKLHKICSELFIDANYLPNNALGEIAKHSKKKKIRIGYYSSDYHNHATAHLISELFELHNKDEFELVGFSFGKNQKSKIRDRITECFDRFIDVNNQSDIEVAQLSRELDIDIAVDLKGFTTDARTGIFAYRAAPVQVSYLGYPGTMGASYIDYLIADETIIPRTLQKNYTEKIIYLPHCYQINDRKRYVSSRIFTKIELGLPENGIIFCCFNNNYKILPQIVDSWTNILKNVEGSILWLYEENEWAPINLAKEFETRGISRNRIVFAPRMVNHEHLARQKCADLFLDTFPYNAHTTASDALWVGLPVLTLIGQSFASRVAASLLNTIGLAELVTTNINEYESVAIDLGNNPKKLYEIKQKLRKKQSDSPLFDSPTFTKNLENAYKQIMNRHWSGFAVENLTINNE